MNMGHNPERGELCNEQYVLTVHCMMYHFLVLSYVTTHGTYSGFAHKLCMDFVHAA